MPPAPMVMNPPAALSVISPPVSMTIFEPARRNSPLSAAAKRAPPTSSTRSPRDLEVLFLVDLLDAAAADDDVALFADQLAALAFDDPIEIPLAVHEQLLGAGLVVESQLVEAGAALRGAAF